MAWLGDKELITVFDGHASLAEFIKNGSQVISIEFRMVGRQ
jgi:hypothetical protein